MRITRNATICFLLVLVLSIALTGVCFADGGDGSEATPINIERIAGANRYETSLLIGHAAGQGTGSQVFYEGVIIACGTDYADALGSAAIQTTGWMPGPVLLVNDDPQVMKAVAENIKAHYKFNPYEDMRQIWIMGGNGAVSEKMEQILADAGLPSVSIERMAGSNRYETNLSVLWRYFGANNRNRLIICSGKDFADALSASATKYPIMIVGDALTENQKKFI